MSTVSIEDIMAVGWQRQSSIDFTKLKADFNARGYSSITVLAEELRRCVGPAWETVRAASASSGAPTAGLSAFAAGART